MSVYLKTIDFSIQITVFAKSYLSVYNLVFCFSQLNKQENKGNIYIFFFKTSPASDSYPRAVLLLMSSPVVSRVTKHQQVTRQPIRAAVATLRGHGNDLSPPPQVHLQPLVAVRDERRPTSSSCGGWGQRVC